MATAMWKFRSLYFALGLSMGVFFPYISILLKTDGLSSVTIGILVSIGILASMLVQPVWGILADRYRSARLIMAGIFLVPAFIAILFNARSIALLAITVVILYVMKGPQASVANAYTLHAAEDLAPKFGRIRYFQSLGFGIGGYVAGIYLTRFNLSQLWELFASVSVLSVLTLVALPPMGKRPESSETELGTMGNVWSLFRNNHGYFALFLLGSLLVNQTIACFTTYLAVVFRQDGGAIGNLGWAIIVASAGNVVTMTIAERLTKRFGTVPILLVASLLFFLRWAIQYFVDSPVWIIFIQILHGSFGLFYIPAVRYVDLMSPAETHVTSQAVFAMIAGTMGLSAIIGNVLEGYLLHAGGPQAMYGISSLSAVAGALCFVYIIINSRHRARTAAAV